MQKRNDGNLFIRQPFAVGCRILSLLSIGRSLKRFEMVFLGRVPQNHRGGPFFSDCVFELVCTNIRTEFFVSSKRVSEGWTLTETEVASLFRAGECQT